MKFIRVKDKRNKHVIINLSKVVSFVQINKHETNICFKNNELWIPVETSIEVFHRALDAMYDSNNVLDFTK